MKDKKSADQLGKLSYEEALLRLEAIVEKLEDAEIPLEESIAAFQEGIALSKYCREKLTEIEFKVDYLLKEEQQALEGEDCNTDNQEEETLS